MGDKNISKKKKKKSSKFVCIKSSLQFMNILCPFCRNFKISRNSSYGLIFAPKVYVALSISEENADKGCNSIRAETIVTSLSRDIPIAQKIIS